MHSLVQINKYMPTISLQKKWNYFVMFLSK